MSSKGEWMYGKYASRTALTAVSVVLSLGVLTACSDSGEPDQPDKDGGIKSRSNAPYWVNPQGNAAKQVAEYRKENKDSEAKLIERIAGQPVAEWVGTEDPEGETRGFTEAAQKDGRGALLVLYNLPHRDCGQYSKGGAADGNAYRGWLDGVIKGIGKRKATVIVEPDSLPHLLQEGCTPQQFHEERYALLKEAVQKLKQLPKTKVYLDAGNPGFTQDPGALVQPLQRAGIDQADGFSLNVSNFITTEDNTTYGKKLSAMVGNKPFVIDTSRNGNGPPGGQGEDAWCNPAGRALGEPPTTKTGDPLVDAYLWVKRPGESDGTCHGGPKAGQWWPEYALGLAKNAK